MTTSSGAATGLSRAIERTRASPGDVLRRLVARARARLALRGCARAGPAYVFGPVRVEGRRGVVLGRRVTFAEGMLPTHLAAGPGATLEIGEDTVLNYGVSIEARASVRIGRRCMLASYVRIGDAGRTGAAPVEIEDEVWLAHGVIVEPGVRIGAGSVVSAGSVVTRDVPPGSLTAGNPARSMSLALASAAPATTPAPLREPPRG